MKSLAIMLKCVLNISYDFETFIYKSTVAYVAKEIPLPHPKIWKFHAQLCYIAVVQLRTDDSKNNGMKSHSQPDNRKCYSQMLLCKRLATAKNPRVFLNNRLNLTLGDNVPWKIRASSSWLLFLPLPTSITAILWGA